MRTISVIRAMLLPLILGMAGSFPVLAEEPSALSAMMQTAKFMGRFDFSSPAGPLCAWSGSTVSGRFTGKSISAVLKPSGGNVYVTAFVDGQPMTSVRLIRKTVLRIADNLPDGEHTVEIVKRTEASEGDLQFMGFEVPADGKLLPPPADSERRIAFIGDSITCGYGVSGPAEAPWNMANEDFTGTYAFLTAKQLKADYHTTAWSGKGVFQNYNPEVKSPNMVELYNQVRASKPKLQWDMKAWIPDVVVINLGTNDFVKPVDTGRFADAYAAFVRTLRGHYPKAAILVTFLSRADVNPHVLRVVDILKSEGDANVHSLIYSPEDTKVNGSGSGNHPSPRTHAIMASELGAAISRITGW